MAISCVQCGAVVQDGSTFCSHCGAAAASTVDILPVQAQTAGAGGSIAAPFSNALLEQDSTLEGIGGWLILVAIGLVLSPLLILGQISLKLVPVLFMPAAQPFLQSHPAIHALILGEIATNLIMVLLLLWINFLFFTRKRAFPSFMVFYLCFQLAIALADHIAAQAVVHRVPSSGGIVIARAVIAALVWIPYLLISRRVRVTFVR